MHVNSSNLMLELTIIIHGCGWPLLWYNEIHVFTVLMEFPVKWSFVPNNWDHPAKLFKPDACGSGCSHGDQDFTD